MTYRLLINTYWEDFTSMADIKAIVKELGLKDNDYHTQTRRVR